MTAANTKTRALTEDELESVSILCNEARGEVRVLNIDPAAEIVSAISERVREIQREKRIFDPNEPYAEIAYQLGALWGNQFVSELGWDWLFLEIDDSTAYIVASPDRSMIIYPINFIDICVKKQDVDVTIALAFNMLTAGEVPDIPPNSYVNVMAHVKHIVPNS